jgi:thioredoxin-dependent peroxiredoxin
MKAAIVLMVLTLAGIGFAAVPAAAGDLKVGDQAPNFKLQATDGKTYQLSDFKGKESVVLAWFPKAFTQGCTIECKSLAEHGDMIKRYNAQYFMISVDPLDGDKGNKAFADTYHADFPLLSDPSKDTANAYGVFNGERGVANRWTFYIGKDGKITAIDKTVKPATSAEDMAAMLKQLGVEDRKK